MTSPGNTQEDKEIRRQRRQRRRSDLKEYKIQEDVCFYIQIFLN